MHYIPCPPKTLGRTVIGLSDLRVVKLFLVGDGEDSDSEGEKRDSTRGDAAGDDDAEDVGGIDNQS